MTKANSTVIALDMGERRIGIAVASKIVKLPEPHKTIEHSKDIIQIIQNLANELNTEAIVVGYPRGLNGQETAQSQEAAKFSEELKRSINLPVYLQDEAVTSKQAEAELNKKGVRYNKGDIDALAATYILDDWLAEHQEF